MDIFEYIDRVKANFDKKPEPRYNMKNYFMGGSVTTPKRGLVDEPGSYSILDIYETKQQLIVTWGSSVNECLEEMNKHKGKSLGIVNCLNFGHVISTGIL